MATTPEGKVKKAIRSVLDSYGTDLYQFWPVPSGYGHSSLDVIVCYCGMFFAIEAKAPGEEPTPRQKFTISQITHAEGIVLVIDDPEGAETLRKWLDKVHEVHVATKKQVAGIIEDMIEEDTHAGNRKQ